jgi:hypothetical protein
MLFYFTNSKLITLYVFLLTCYILLSFSNSCYGQTLSVSTYLGETLYCIFLAVLGLVLFAHLIGNVQVFFIQLTACFVL